ncbi:hypothetical protein BDZ97DRAFT_1653935 [Flammula alnicola]|nr:hypothetical protein BDZ97DRAFT_1653935 [Flammula alnicola]
MGLLGWEVLSPQNSIAAVLYPSPVRVSSIRVFPTGAQPFSQSPETLAVTEPAAFFLDVFFNAHPIQVTSVSQDSQEKRVVKNALAPTRIAYAGGSTEFTVDMGPEYATRLIIFRGDFEVISVAIYGEVVTEIPEVSGYETKPLPAPTSMTLSPSVDLASSTNPTLLAENLLSLLPTSPPLSLVSRLVFSLKPEDEDWDDPDFPYIYSDLDNDEVMDLEGLVQSVTRPIRDDISPETLSRFATKMHDYLGSNPSDDAYFVAKLLTKAASQQTRISRTLLQHIDLPKVFNEHTLDETTILCLLDAAANIEIARYFSEDEEFLKGFEELQSSPKIDKSTQKALKRLLTRLRGWQSFEDALSNPDGDFAASAAFLKDIATGELSLGCWLECMLIHDNLATKLRRHPVPSRPQPPPLPLLFQERHSAILHVQFIAFVRALLGVSSVLAALAWADSIGNSPCRERALGVLVLWQGVDGYREIVNHCLLLRQLTKRLGWNKTDDVPTKSGNLAERLLVGLAKDPQAMLRECLVDTVLSLEPPFSFIEAEEMLEIGKLARVARDGLSSAIEELTYTSVRPFSLRRLRVLRVSLAIVEEELAYDDGEWHVLDSFWDEHHQGIAPTLTSMLVDISDDLNHHFALTPMPCMNQALSDLLFRTADDLLHLITRFVLVYPSNGRDLRHISTAIADLYACSRAACARFCVSSAAHLAALNIRQTCPQILRNFTDPNVHVEVGTSSAQIALRALLDHASQSAGRDPVYHILQLYDLIDNILPQPGNSMSNGTAEADIESSFWTASIFPKVLPELTAFCHLLEAETRAVFVERLQRLDNGETGIGEWLLIEEMNNLSTTLNNLAGSTQEDNYRLILRYQISTSILFFDLLLSSSRASAWAVSSLSSNADLSQLFDSCLSLILDANLSSLSLTRFTRQLAKHASDFGPDVRFNILLLTLRNARMDPSVGNALDFVPGMLESLPSTAISVDPLRNEVGRMISAYSDHAPSLKEDNAEMLLLTLEWLASQEDVKLSILGGISLESFHYLCSMLAAVLSSARMDALTTVETKLSIDEDETFPPSTTELPEALTLPLQSIENLLSPKPFEPSTPKRGTKTPDILGVVISPPAALLRSPAATGLTKTYTANDFRQLRQVPSTRLNTSRLPSTHG